MIEIETHETNVTLTPSNREKLWIHTGGVPLAIIWSIAQISSGLSADAVISRLAVLSPDDDLMRFCFSGISDGLKGSPQFSALLALSLFAGAANVKALCYVSGSPVKDETFDRILVNLVRLSLVSRIGESITMLPLTRTFTTKELENSSLGHEYRCRFIDFYLTSTADADKWDRDVLIAELHNIRQAIDVALNTHDMLSACRLVLNVSRPLYIKGLYTMTLELWERLLTLDLEALALQVRNEAATVFASGPLYAYLRNGRGKVAFDFLRDAVPGLEKAGDFVGLSIVLQRLGIISRDLRAQGSLEIAKEYLEKAAQCAFRMSAITEADKVSQKRIVADIKNGLGAVAILEGEFSTALQVLGEADALFEELQDKSTRSSVARHLAEVARLSGHMEEAEALCMKAIAFATNSERQDRLADAFQEMALIESARGSLRKASRWATRAGESFASIGAFASAKQVKSLAVNDLGLGHQILTGLEKLFKIR